MEVLLIKDVDRLGKRGKLVKVRPGYARNHLLPLGYAVTATAENKRHIEKRRLQWLAEEAKLVEELRELAGRLGTMDIKIVGKASDAGHLYGSVTEKAIADALAASGVQLDPRVIRLEQHLKDVGDYEVLLRLHEEVEVTLPVKVRAEGREDWVPGEEIEARPAEEEPSATAVEEVPDEE